jgi:hypothetical protein
MWAEPVGGGYPILWWQLSLLPELPFSGGTGETDEPYLISTANELNSIGHNPRLMNAHFKLINDIDLTGIDLFIIGNELFPFTGVFDGNGKKIYNFTYTSWFAGRLARRGDHHELLCCGRQRFGKLLRRRIGGIIKSVGHNHQLLFDKQRFGKLLRRRIGGSRRTAGIIKFVGQHNHQLLFDRQRFGKPECRRIGGME